MNAPKRSKPTEPGALRGQLSHKSSNRMFLHLPQRGDLERARKRILEYGADGDFDKLVAANCEPGMLLVLLANVSRDGPALDTWEARFGVSDPRQLKSAIRRMKQCAEDFVSLDRSGLLRLAAWPKLKSELSLLQFLDYFAAVPKVLKGCADSLETAVGSARFKPRAHSFSNTALAQLVAYVQKRTGAAHDSEVSALLDAVCKKGKGGDPYAADTLKTWRAEHAHYIRDAAQMFPFLFGK